MTESNPDHQSITVWIPYRVDRNVHPFYCSNCGKCLCEIVGGTEEILYGEPTPPEIHDLGIRYILKCNGTIFISRNGKDKMQCKTTYYFR